MTRFLILLVLLGSSSVFAQSNELERRVYRLERTVQDLTNRVQWLERGTGGGEGIEVESKVDLQCFHQIKGSIPHFPSFNEVVEWAGRCRVGIIQQDRCVVHTTLNDNDCFHTLKGSVNRFPNSEETFRMTEACKVVRARCRI